MNSGTGSTGGDIEIEATSAGGCFQLQRNSTKEGHGTASLRRSPVLRELKLP